LFRKIRRFGMGLIGVLLCQPGTESLSRHDKNPCFVFISQCSGVIGITAYSAVILQHECSNDVKNLLLFDVVIIADSSVRQLPVILMNEAYHAVCVLPDRMGICVLIQHIVQRIRYILTAQSLLAFRKQARHLDFQHIRILPNDHNNRHEQP